MKKGIPGIVERLRLIAIHKTRGPWEHLVNDLADVAKVVYLNVGYDANVEGWPVFRDWFPGWFMTKRKIEATLDWVDRTRATGKLADSSDEDAAATNYLKKVLETAVHEFDRESRGRTYATGGSVESGLLESCPTTTLERRPGKQIEFRSWIKKTLVLSGISWHRSHQRIQSLSCFAITKRWARYSKAN